MIRRAAMAVAKAALLEQAAMGDAQARRTLDEVMLVMLEDLYVSKRPNVVDELERLLRPYLPPAR